MKISYVAAALALTMPAARAQTPATLPIMPGQWRITITVKSIDIPGAPPSVGKAMLGQPRTYSQCITPDQAANGPRDMLKGGMDCSMPSYSAEGGRINAEMQCVMPGGMANGRATGTYTPTSFSASTSAMVSGRIAMRMTGSVTGQRTGDCGA